VSAGSGLRGRALARDEIAAIWTIDRGETIEGLYRVEGGALVLRPERIELEGWPEGEADRYGPLLESCHDRGGWLHGLFDGARLVAVAVLDPRPLGPEGDRMQLKMLYVDRALRGRGVGRALFGLACDEAARRGARGLNVSATPSEHTIRFYLELGCRLAPEPDPELLALEPEDVHLDHSLEPS
jgi:GNAT superfamily N-acetyltransferase